MSHYAVRVGRKPGIYRSWDECKEQVHGFPGARYKKFNTKDEAEIFIGCGDAGGGERGGGASGSGGGGFTRNPHKVNIIKHNAPTFKSKNSSTTTGGKSWTKHMAKSTTTTTTTRTPTQPMNTQRQTFVTRNNLPSAPVVYTDGCCTNNGRRGAVGGVGVYWGPHHPNNISEYLDVPVATNNIAELRAASRALESAIGMGLRRVELRTDSKYTMQSMMEWIDGWKRNGWRTSSGGEVANVGEMMRLDELCGKIDVTWVHVPGHEGVWGNEEADRLAREGAAKGR